MLELISKTNTFNGSIEFIRGWDSKYFNEIE